MSHFLRTAALAVGTCVLLVLPLATPAGAAVVYVHDPPGDGSNGTGGGGPRQYGDIGTVRVAHGDGRMWLTVNPARGGQLADRYEFWVDVNIANPGPEFLVDFTLEVSPEVRVSQTDRFGQSGAQPVPAADRRLPTGHAGSAPQRPPQLPADARLRGAGAAAGQHPCLDGVRERRLGARCPAVRTLGQERLTVARPPKAPAVWSRCEDASNEPRNRTPIGGVSRLASLTPRPARLCGGSVAVAVPVTGTRGDGLLVLGLLHDQRLGRQQHAPRSRWR